MNRRTLIVAAALLLAAVVLVVAVAPRATAQAGPPRWEYLMVSAMPTGDTMQVYAADEPIADLAAADYPAVLNYFGSDSWELVTLERDARHAVFYFKRQLP